MSVETENSLVRELTKVMTEIGLDIREIKTTLKHFGEKFDDIQGDINEVKIIANETQHEVDTLKLEMNTVKNQSDNTKDDVQILFDKFKERDRKSDTDRKWLIGTVLSVVALTITCITFIINYIA